MRINSPHRLFTDNKVPKGTVVSPSTPRSQHNIYWGYNVRLANSLSDVFVSTTYKYDCLLGTSERGDPVDGFSFNKFKLVFNEVNILL